MSLPVTTDVARRSPVSNVTRPGDRGVGPPKSPSVPTPLLSLDSQTNREDPGVSGNSFRSFL